MSGKTIAEQLEALKATRDAQNSRMEAVAQKSIDEGRSMNTAESEEFDTLEGEVKSLDGDIARLTRLQSAKALNAQPVDQTIIKRSDPNNSRPLEGVQVKNTQKLEPGQEFARYAMCLTAAKGDTEKAFRIASTHYPENEQIVNTLKAQSNSGRSLETVMKATVEAGTTLDTTWAAPLVEYQNFAGDFVEFLRPQTILGQFGTNGRPSLNRIPFNVRIAGQTSGGQGYWVGEGAPKPLTAFDFNSVELRWAKVANIAVLTEELMRFSNPSAELLVRNALADALRARLDIDFIDPAKAAVANVSPASITNGVTPIESSGSDAAAIRADIQALWAPFIAANNPPSTAVYIMSSTTALALSMMMNPLGTANEFPGITMNGGTLGGVPVIVSEYAAGLVILVNARDVWLADDGGFTIDASREASLQMLDNPTNNSATGTATSMVSMFQTNSVALRVERYINWAKRRASAVQYMEVTWGQPDVGGGG